MNRLLWSCAALFTLFVTVEALSCNTCAVDILGSCLINGVVNCTNTQDRCYTAVARFSADLLDIHERGCIEQSKCINSTGSILNVNYKITKTCCSGSNLCNAAVVPQRSLTAVLAAALVVVLSQWGL